MKAHVDKPGEQITLTLSLEEMCEVQAGMLLLKQHNPHPRNEALYIAFAETIKRAAGRKKRAAKRPWVVSFTDEVGQKFTEKFTLESDARRCFAKWNEPKYNATITEVK